MCFASSVCSNLVQTWFNALFIFFYWWYVDFTTQYKGYQKACNERAYLSTAWITISVFVTLVIIKLTHFWTVLVSSYFNTPIVAILISLLKTENKLISSVTIARWLPSEKIEFFQNYFLQHATRIYFLFWIYFQVFFFLINDCDKQVFF